LLVLDVICLDDFLSPVSYAGSRSELHGQKVGLYFRGSKAMFIVSGQKELPVSTYSTGGQS